MKRSSIGPLLIFIGIFGGGILCILACGFQFDYLVHEVYGYDLGEPIWVLDPGFTLIAATPGLFIIFLGLLFMAGTTQTENSMNWIYIGSMMLLITGITSAVIVSGSITMLHNYHSIINLVLFGAITVTCGITTVYFLVTVPRFGIMESIFMQRVRIFSISIVSELVMSALIISIFQLDTWSAVRRAFFVIQLSGWLGIVLLMTGWLLIKSHRKSGESVV